MLLARGGKYLFRSWIKAAILIEVQHLELLLGLDLALGELGSLSFPHLVAGGFLGAHRGQQQHGAGQQHAHGGLHDRAAARDDGVVLGF